MTPVKKLPHLSRRIMSGSASIIVAIGFLFYLLNYHVPDSLSEAIGTAGYIWMIALIVSSFASGVLDILSSPFRHSTKLLTVAFVAHILAAVFLLGYAVGVVFGPTRPTITIGLAFSAIVFHLTQWRRIVEEELPLTVVVKEFEEQP